MALILMDGKEIQIENGATVLSAAYRNGIEIPHYCFHPAMKIVGSCRMCLVEIDGMPKLQTSCSTKIGEAPPNRKIDGKYDMVIHTQSEKVKKARKTMLEFLLLNHPLDCPVCDQAGECFLQDYTYEYGSSHSRFIEEKLVRPKEDFGSGIQHDPNRCIMCTRCIRFTREVSGTKELHKIERGNHNKIGIFEDKPLDNPLAGNVTDVCPVGAMLPKDSLHKERVWNYDVAETVCGVCARGCNTNVSYRENQIFRITPRRNMDINDWWMCDRGRYFHHEFETKNRIETPKCRQNSELSSVSWEGVFNFVREDFARVRKEQKDNFSVGIVASPFLTNEELFTLSDLAHSLDATVYRFVDTKIGEKQEFPQGFKISDDFSPNSAGLDKIFTNADDVANLKKHSVLFVPSLVAGFEFSDSTVEQMKKAKLVIAIQDEKSAISDFANAILPAQNFYEKTGSIVNEDGWIQRMNSIGQSEKFRFNNWEIFLKLQNLLVGKSAQFSSVSEVFSNVIREKFGLEATFFGLKKEAIQMNGGK